VKETEGRSFAVAELERVRNFALGVGKYEEKRTTEG
jgi:hypothetical protein